MGRWRIPSATVVFKICSCPIGHTDDPAPNALPEMPNRCTGATRIRARLPVARKTARQLMTIKRAHQSGSRIAIAAMGCRSVPDPPFPVPAGAFQSSYSARKTDDGASVYAGPGRLPWLSGRQPLFARRCYLHSGHSNPITDRHTGWQPYRWRYAQHFGLPSPNTDRFPAV